MNELITWIFKKHKYKKFHVGRALDSTTTEATRWNDGGLQQQRWSSCPFFVIHLFSVTT